MNKKSIIVLCAVVLVVTFTVLGIRVFSGEDGWVCQNGQWKKHGYPSKPMPEASCGENLSSKNSAKNSSALDNADVTEIEENSIVVIKPNVNDAVASPLEIAGTAKGSWFFEGQFPIKLVDEKGTVIAQGTAEANGEWMKEGPIDFQAHLEFSVPKLIAAKLIFSQDDPSGQGQVESYEIPVNLQ